MLWCHKHRYLCFRDLLQALINLQLSWLVKLSRDIANQDDCTSLRGVSNVNSYYQRLIGESSSYEVVPSGSASVWLATPMEDTETQFTTIEYRQEND